MYSYLRISLIFLTVITLFIGCVDINHEMSINKTDSNTILISDSLNTPFIFDKIPDRIITTDIYATEFLILLGASDKIVGVGKSSTENLDILKNLNNPIVIKDSSNINIEKVISLNPDVIIIPSTTPNLTTERLNQTNIQYLIFDCYFLNTLDHTVTQMGILTNKNEKAAEYVNFKNKYLSIIKERTENISINNQPRVYYEMSGIGATAGKGSGGYFFMEILNVNNIASEINMSMPKVTTEWIIKNDPEIIIKSGKSSDSIKDNYNSIKNREGYENISAIKSDNVFSINSNIMYGPRLIVGLLYLAKVFYPDRFEDIDPDMVLDEYAAIFINGTNKTQNIYPYL